MLPQLVSLRWFLDVCIASLCHSETKDDFISTKTHPALGITVIVSAWRKDAELHIRNMFFKVWHEMQREGKFMITIVVGVDMLKKYT